VNVKKYLENRIRGWLPKSSILTRTHETGKPRWWRPLWIVTGLGIIVSGAFVFHRYASVTYRRIILWLLK
jgi:heme A synthase